MSTYVSLSQVLAVTEKEHTVIFENFSLEDTASSADLEVQNEVDHVVQYLKKQVVYVVYILFHSIELAVK